MLGEPAARVPDEQQGAHRRSARLDGNRGQPHLGRANGLALVDDALGEDQFCALVAAGAGSASPAEPMHVSVTAGSRRQ